MHTLSPAFLFIGIPAYEKPSWKPLKKSEEQRQQGIRKTTKSLPDIGHVSSDDFVFTTDTIGIRILSGKRRKRYLLVLNRKKALENNSF